MRVVNGGWNFKMRSRLKDGTVSDAVFEFRIGSVKVILDRKPAFKGAELTFGECCF